MNRTLIILAAILIVLGCSFARAEKLASQLTLEILSNRNLDGIAGDFVTVAGQITNAGQEPISDITTYLSLVDTSNKQPVDLEDWSVEKGLYIGTIEPGQTLPLNWKIHFVKAGGFALTILAITAGNENPNVSPVTHFHVRPKHSLDPAHVLPVALGVPLVLAFLLLILNYRPRSRKTLPGEKHPEERSG
jgi:hypothetical protein